MVAIIDIKSGSPKTIAAHAIQYSRDSAAQNPSSGLVVVCIRCVKSQAGGVGPAFENPVVQQPIAYGFKLIFYEVHTSGKQALQRIFGDGNRRGQDHVCSSVRDTPHRGPRGKVAGLGIVGCSFERPVVKKAANMFSMLFYSLWCRMRSYVPAAVECELAHTRPRGARDDGVTGTARESVVICAVIANNDSLRNRIIGCRIRGRLEKYIES